MFVIAQDGESGPYYQKVEEDQDLPVGMGCLPVSADKTRLNLTSSAVVMVAGVVVTVWVWCCLLLDGVILLT